MLEEVLIRAGIGPVDPSSRVVGMHSLRHGYTALAKAGVPIKTPQTLARHSDPKLTLNTYSHLMIHDTAAALDFLPDLTIPRSELESLAATGTDPSMDHIENNLALHLPYAGDGASRFVSETGDTTETTPGEGVVVKAIQRGI
jgi:hypothetical protein